MDWQRVHQPPKLEDDDIHVWRFPLTAGGKYRHLMDGLADDEVRRAERFLFEHHREHFVVGRFRVRQLLAHYVNQNPASIVYAYDNLGKPRFAAEHWNQEIRFNFSNSHDGGLLAVTRASEIGVDIERLRPLSDMMGLARRYFAESESRQLLALPPPERTAAFFRFWTRKEAYLKAVGKGLTFPLRSVEVTMADDQQCRICHIDHDVKAAKQWSLRHLEPGDGYVGAFAVQRTVSNVILIEPMATINAE